MAKAYASTVISAPADKVWALIRDFNSLADWLPVVADSMIEDGKSGDQIGAVRNFHLQDGAHLRERLLSHSDTNRSYSYNFELTPFDVQNYHATIRVTPVTDSNASFVEWWTTFDSDVAAIDQWVDLFANQVFKGGLDAINAHFSG